MYWKLILVGVFFAFISNAIFSFAFKKSNIKMFMKRKKVNCIMIRILILIVCFFISMACTNLIHDYANNKLYGYMLAGVLTGLFTELITVFYNSN